MDLTFTFPLPAGLHARPASMLQKEAARFLCSVTFVNRSKNSTADARSTLALLSTLTANGDECILRIEGEDGQSAYAALKEFIERVLPHADDGAQAVPPIVASEAARPRALKGAAALRGTAVSPGIGVGPAFHIGGASRPRKKQDGTVVSPSEEVQRFDRAVEKVQAEIAELLRAGASKTSSAILQVHRSIATDPVLSERVKAGITTRKQSAEDALASVSGDYAQTLNGADSPYLRERAFDVQDVAERILCALSGATGEPRSASPAELSVCIAERLSAQELLALGKERIAALILQRGETTSHVVILARALGIPCVSGVRGAERLLAGHPLIVDAYRGIIFQDPTKEVERFYKGELRIRAEQSERMVRDAARPGTSRDGARLEIGANCASPEEVRTAVKNGAEGVGVFRTELAFADRENPPTEEEHLKLYLEIVEAAEGRPIIFRTFDVGGDKPVRWLPLPAEENPFLGYRAVRMYEEYGSVIDAQIRAILRAAARGPVQIMFPMVASPAEVHQLRERVQRCQVALAREGINHRPDVPVGIMVEIPSAVMLMDHLCDVVDFFSVGSNDLAQYLAAADRGNEKVRHLCSGIQPALLRSFQHVLEEAHKRGKWVGLCGELAGEERALPLLLGLGFDELSVGPRGIPRLKAWLRSMNKSECIPLARAALQAPSASDVERILLEFVSQPGAVELTESNLVVLASKATTKDELLRELLSMLDDGGRIDSVDDVLEAVLQREDTFSTAMEHGMALPHCKSAHVLVPSIAVARLLTTCQWSDGEAGVRLVLLITIPERSAASAHLKIIATLARRLMHEEFREALLQASTRETVVELILREAGSVAALPH